MQLQDTVRCRANPQPAAATHRHRRESGGGVFTADNDRGLGIARQVRTGTYMVNSSIPIDFSSPFGGYKDSGVGREFGEDGLELFLEKKTINLPAGYTPSI